MRTFVFALAALTCTAGAIRPARCSPASHAERASASEGYSTSALASIDLQLRPSVLAATTPHHEGVDINPPPPAPAPRGQFVGPIFLDGVYAQHLKKLPRQMREGMQRNVGPTPVFFENMTGLGSGAGAGLYARF